ncbi:MAG TPA: hypothetical protein VMV86_00300 [Methanosarcinales archaeon]|nr:hypothetical protein [Methanosarcinales archaeon]
MNKQDMKATVKALHQDGWHDVYAQNWDGYYTVKAVDTVTGYPRNFDERYYSKSQIRRQIRKAIGLVEFERTCRKVKENGRLKKAYHVPGTPEQGKHVMLMTVLHDRLEKQYN